MKRKFTTLLLLVVFGLSGSLQAQSKKEQIEILKTRVDSLNTVNSELNIEIKNLSESMLEKNNIINANKDKIASQSEELKKRNDKINELMTSNNGLQQTVLMLKDSIDAYKLLIGNLNSNKIIDSVYSINRLNNLIMVNEISFRNREKFHSNNLEIRYIDTKETYGFNSMTENAFLFISFSSKSLLLKSKTGFDINISVLNEGKIIDNKSYYWIPDYDGNYYIWFPLEKNYFDCIIDESNFKIDIKEEKTKALVSSAIIKYSTYCETD
jgi:regulator of replication initiation timing